MDGLKIDWRKEGGYWQVWSLDGVLLESARRVILSVPCELVNTDRDTHGWLVTVGRLERRGDTLFIGR